MRTAFLKGHFCRPAGHEGEHDVEARKGRIGGEVEAGLSLASRVPADHPPQKQGGTASAEAIPLTFTPMTQLMTLS